MLENHAFDEIVAHSDAPFLNSLVANGALLTNSFAVTHPSQPNYLALFSGSTQGITDDSCPQTFSAGNLARSLFDAGFSFAGYSEDLPSVGYTGCSAGLYARKHNPWVDFSNLPAVANQPLTAFPADFAQLPTVSFLIPNEAHDMHSGTVANADAWLSLELRGYAQWAPTHNSLLLVTTDEDDYSSSNRIATIIAGAHVRTGRFGTRVDHYGVLRTIESMYHLPLLGNSAGAAAISDIWSR
jgi:phosphatidylinositol-3-phosphatase